MPCMAWARQVAGMSDIFSEVYGTYYNIVADIFRQSCKGRTNFGAAEKNRIQRWL